MIHQQMQESSLEIQDKDMVDTTPSLHNRD